jgi:hypothetical protein
MSHFRKELPAMIAQAEAIDTLEVDLPGFAQEIRELHRQTTIEGILTIGERLDIANQELSKHGTGKFIEWVESNLPFTRMTANRYMVAYRAFGGRADCNSLLQTCTAEALYALARKPAKVQEKAIAKANAGKRIDLAAVKSLGGEKASKAKDIATAPVTVDPNGGELQQLIAEHPEKLTLARILFDACSIQERAQVLTLWSDWWEAAQ